MNKINKNFENWFYEKSKNINNINYKDLEKVTIVIPSYERQDYLLRQLIYWYGSGIKLIILDGSSLSLPQNILEFISSWKNITYLHLPISIEARVNQAINYINTPYVALLSDDEFFLKGALKNLVIKLDEDRELSGCIGQSVEFSFDKNNKKVKYNKGYPHWEYSVNHDSIKKRIIYAMSQYNAATAYGLYRKDVWQNGWGDIKKYSCGYTSEMYQALVTYISGKYIATDELYWLRSSENIPIETKEWDRKLRFHEWWKDKKYQLEKEEFLIRLENIILMHDKVSKKEAREIILSAVKVYLDFCDSYFKISWKMRLRLLIVKFIKIFLPKKLFQKLKSRFGLKHNIQKPLYQNVKYPWLEFTQSNNIEENQKEMIEIEELIKEFHLLKSL